MVRKKTLGFKKQVCRFCRHAGKRALRHGRPYCDSEYASRNGLCANADLAKKRK